MGSRNSRVKCKRNTTNTPKTANHIKQCYLEAVAVQYFGLVASATKSYLPEWYLHSTNLTNASVLVATILLSFCHSLGITFSFMSFISIYMETFVIVGLSPTVLEDLSG